MYLQHCNAFFAKNMNICIIFAMLMVIECNATNRIAKACVTTLNRNSEYEDSQRGLISNCSIINSVVVVLGGGGKFWGNILRQTYFLEKRRVIKPPLRDFFSQRFRGNSREFVTHTYLSSLLPKKKTYSRHIPNIELRSSKKMI